MRSAHSNSRAPSAGPTVREDAAPASDGRRLRVICVDCEAPPLILPMRDGRRGGFESDVAELIAAAMGREVSWVCLPWAEMVPALDAELGDIILCGQAVTEERATRVGYTEPYAIFDESVLVRAGSKIVNAEGLRGRRVAAIHASTNMALAHTFPDVVPVAFDGASDDVFGDMVAALRRGEVDAVVDDDVVTVPLGDDPDLTIAFTVHTRNEWAIAVAKRRPQLLREVGAALTTIRDDGRLAKTWARWMPHLLFPLNNTTQERSDA